MGLKTYNLKEVAIVCGGNLGQGFSDGDAVTVEYDDNIYNTSVGADGEVTRSKSNNRVATITIRLQKTSDFNDVLNNFYQSDRLSDSGVFPFMLKDNKGRELHAAEKCWIEKEPSIAFGKEAGDREWTLKTNELVSTFGGN